MYHQVLEEKQTKCNDKIKITLNDIPFNLDVLQKCVP